MTSPYLSHTLWCPWFHRGQTEEEWKMNWWTERSSSLLTGDHLPYNLPICDFLCVCLQKVSRMKSKNMIQKYIYGILDWFEKNRSEHITLFWRCVFEDIIINQYPTLRMLRNSLMDGQTHFSHQHFCYCDLLTLNLLMLMRHWLKLNLHTLFLLQIDKTLAKGSHKKLKPNLKTVIFRSGHE